MLVPTSNVMAQLLEDYRLSRIKERSWDLVYKTIVENTWIVEALEAIHTNTHFCKLTKQRFKSAPDATIDFVEYKWLIVCGQFDMVMNCAAVYTNF